MDPAPLGFGGAVAGGGVRGAEAPAGGPGAKEGGGRRGDFLWTAAPEPHAVRRKAILERYSEKIRPLYGNDPWYVPPRALVACAIQLGLAVACARLDLGWKAITLLSYCVGAFCAQNLFLAIHELSHNLAFVSPAHNRAMGFVCNLHVGAPVFVPFKYYHQRHHTFQGYDGIDDDIPSLGECNVVVNTIAKAVWLFFQTEVYALRPLITTPKPFTKWDLIGWALCIAYDAALYTLVGPKALGYVLLSTHWGGSIHPIAGHFISEHYLDVLNEVEGLEEQETFSYYGPLNAITYNVGYHNEHHDFPQIPGSRLPQVRKIAPEFYEPLRSYNSWAKPIWAYLTDPRVGPFSRVKRHPKKGKKDS